MMLRTLTVLTCCLVAAAFALPLQSENKESETIRQKRSRFGVWDPYGHRKRSRRDFFDKHDFNFDGYLDKLELSLMYVANGASWEEALKFGAQQLRHDLDHNGVLDRWEFLRDNDLMMYWPYYY
ncbi:uncharacterized protein [Argopecten irradians]|uniref:uncharacterized protein n=1 Tax=Argopecten irradians TaxID=31199 RepID=UPI0037123FE8